MHQIILSANFLCYHESITFHLYLQQKSPRRKFDFCCTQKITERIDLVYNNSYDNDFNGQLQSYFSNFI